MCCFSSLVTWEVASFQGSLKQERLSASPETHALWSTNPVGLMHLWHTGALASSESKSEHGPPGVCSWAKRSVAQNCFPFEKRIWMCCLALVNTAVCHETLGNQANGAHHNLWVIWFTKSQNPLPFSVCAPCARLSSKHFTCDAAFNPPHSYWW